MCLFSLVLLINVPSMSSVSVGSSQDIFIRSLIPDLIRGAPTLKPVKPVIHQSDSCLPKSSHQTFGKLAVPLKYKDKTCNLPLDLFSPQAIAVRVSGSSQEALWYLSEWTSEVEFLQRLRSSD